MHVEIRHLTRYFGATHAVDDVSFSFAGGAIFGLVGPNGAGKTTTMRILATLDEPSSGDAWVDGVSVVQEPQRVRRWIGFMPDSLPQHRDITVHDYLDFFARAYGLRRAQRLAAIAQVEEITKLAPLQRKMLRALSKGMKQRVSLARAMVHDPGLLIMDEPAAGLDPRARVELRELVKMLATRGKAILISSHILTELSQICDGAAIMEQGRLVQAGPLDDLYRRLHANRGVAGRVVAIRTARNGPQLVEALQKLPHVTAAELDGPWVQARIDGDEAVGGKVLAELFRQGFEILEFKQEAAGLEELFMSVTKGEVQ